MWADFESSFSFISACASSVWLLATAALMLRHFKAAAEYAARAAALQPSFVRAHIRAGKACLCMGRFDQAGCCPPHQCAQATLSKFLRLL